MIIVAFLSSILVISVICGYVLLCLRQENAFKLRFLDVSEEILNAARAEDMEELRVTESLLDSIDSYALARDSEKIFWELSKIDIPKDRAIAISRVPHVQRLVFLAIGNLFFGAFLSRPWAAFRLSLTLALKGRFALLLALYKDPKNQKECAGYWISSDKKTRDRISKDVYHIMDNFQHAA